MRCCGVSFSACAFVLFLLFFIASNQCIVCVFIAPHNVRLVMNLELYVDCTTSLPHTFLLSFSSLSVLAWPSVFNGNWYWIPNCGNCTKSKIWLENMKKRVEEMQSERNKMFVVLSWCVRLNNEPSNDFVKFIFSINLSVGIFRFCITSHISNISFNSFVNKCEWKFCTRYRYIYWLHFHLFIVIQWLKRASFMHIERDWGSERERKMRLFTMY